MQPNTSPLFLIGEDSHGNWVAQKQHGCTGGLFISRAAALKFALFENGHRPEAIVMVADGLELDLSGRTFTVHHSGPRAEASLPMPHAGMRSRPTMQPAIAQAA